MRPPTAAPRLHKECGRGIAVGGAGSLICAAVVGAPPLLAMLAAIGGGAVGALIGVLLWSGSDAVPDDPVLPPDER